MGWDREAAEKIYWKLLWNCRDGRKDIYWIRFPDEFAHSKYTKAIKGANEKAKANSVSAIGDLISIADNKMMYPDYEKKHGRKAKNGWYRYDTRFGIPVYDESEK